MTRTEASATRRITLELRPWPLRLTFGVRPTVVVDGRTEPAQWGVGTWLVPADRPVEVSAFLFVARLRLGSQTHLVQPDTTHVRYRAPWLPFLPGRMRAIA